MIALLGNWETHLYCAQYMHVIQIGINIVKEMQEYKISWLKTFFGWAAVKGILSNLASISVGA